MRSLIFILLNVFALSSFAQTRKITPDNIVSFKIKNAGIKVDGSFSGLQGTIVFDPKNLAQSSFDVSIKSATVNTGIEARDTHLKKEEYFNAVNYPTINFRSKKIEMTSSGFVTTGTLSIKGKTKEIKIPFTFSENNGEGIFNGSFTINRLDFGVGESSWILSDEATVVLAIKTLKP
ncbi:MAG TPA: YceI family protein [Cytophagaceae bacterium]|jgi:polyisoprenoid-binding protein YceI|nr:YceI family protein [Cytophagaceae bacterium]